MRGFRGFFSRGGGESPEESEAAYLRIHEELESGDAPEPAGPAVPTGSGKNDMSAVP